MVSLAQPFSIDDIINLLVDKAIFKKIKNKKLILYDLNPLTKDLMEWLFRHDIYVKGFLLEDSRKNYAEIKYLNKPMIYFNDLSGDEIIIDTFGDSVESLTKRCTCQVYRLYTPPLFEPLIIYGAGHRGQELMRLYNIPVLKFCDRDINKHGSKIEGVEVISPETLQIKFSNVTVIVAIEKDAKNIAESLEKNKFAKRCYYYTLPQDYLTLNLSSGSCKFKVIRYIIDCIKCKNRNIIIYGHTDDVIAIIKKFNLLDVTEITGMSAEGFAINRDSITFIDEDDLSVMDLNQTMIIILSNCLDAAQKLINKYSLRFVCQKSEDLFLVSNSTSYDPNLGYVITYGFINLLTKNEVNSKRVGILGDSTTALNLWAEKTWPEYLIDEANKFNISMKMAVAATGAQNSSQMLVRLIRDMSHKNFDIIIYYGGITEMSCIPENRFIHTYQKNLFIKIDNLNHKGIYYGQGIENSAEHWLHQVHMMYAICKELEIKFYAVLSPILTLKNPYSKRDIELLEHIFPSLDLIETLSPLTQHIRLTNKILSKNNYPYIKSFVDIFDNSNEDIFFDIMHVFNHSNEIIAKHMFEMIKSDLQN